MATATILPPNDLHLEDHLYWVDPNITEQEFSDIIDGVMEVYQPIVAEHGATLKTNKKWTDSTVNASAQQMGSSWIVNMYGGLARRPEVTPDGFALVVCHELGHHLAGFPFYQERWAASEGQSDYFATQSCARHIWGSQLEKNAEYRATVNPTAKTECDNIYANEQDQNLCYRTSMAGYSLATLLASLRNKTVSFDTPATNKVSSTNPRHPAGQCRLDTYFHGALCTVDFDMHTIPGRKHPDGQGSEGAEVEAAKNSCTRAAFFNVGTRPRCWYKPQLKSLVTLRHIHTQEVNGNGNGAIEPGEAFSVVGHIENLAKKPYDGITSTLTSTDAALEIIRGESTYSKIGAGQTSSQDRPFEVRVGNDVACGSQHRLKVALQIEGGESYQETEIQIGKLSKSPARSNNTVIDIPDNNSTGITSSIEVDAAIDNNLNFAEVEVDITHTYIGDLRVYLFSPSGEKFALHNRTGGTQNDLKKTFSVNLPQGPSQGTWSLQVSDHANNDRGKLNSWSISFAKFVCE